MCIIDIYHTECKKNNYAFCNAKQNIPYISDVFGHSFPFGTDFNVAFSEFVDSKCPDVILEKLLKGTQTILNESMHSVTSKTTNKTVSTKDGAHYESQVCCIFSFNLKRCDCFVFFFVTNSIYEVSDSGRDHMITLHNCMRIWAFQSQIIKQKS